MSSSTKPLYTGSFRHTLDEKNRLTIPSQWRAAHADGDMFLAVPLEGYIAVLPPPEVDKLYERVSSQSLSDSEAQEAAADLFSKALSFSFDKSGRVMLTPELCAHAGIAKDAMLVGTMSKFHIYSPAEWDRVQAAKAAQKPGDRLRRMGI